jgi:FAD/FMN-containing dehydrogenase
MVDPAVLADFEQILGPKGLVTDPELIAPWLVDWRGRYRGAAPAMLAPASTREVAAVVALAARHRVALVPQGGNTSQVGGATPPPDGSALLLSLRRLNRIRSIDTAENLAVCEAGVILSTLHDAAATAGRRFPLSLGAKGSATIGGLVSTNAGGTQVLRHGTMRALVAGIEAVLPDGGLYDGLSVLRKDNRGYDLKQLLIGGEGTLGIVTAAALRLVPAIADRAVGWVAVPDPHAALGLLRFLEARLGGTVEGFEIVPEHALAATLAYSHGLRRPLADISPWYVLVEADDDEHAVPAMAERLETALVGAIEAGLASDGMVAASEAQADALWALRETIPEAKRAMGPALQFDVSVPVSTMPTFLVEVAAATLARFPGCVVTPFGHLGDGNIHYHVHAPAGPGAAEWLAERSDTITRFVNDAVVAMGGSISAEHGIGQNKVAELVRLASPAHLHALRAIKQALDPLGIMNPGKLVPLASPETAH